MAKIVDNPKRFKVIELSRNELAKIGGIGICDRCNGTSNTGYYVAVLNCWIFHVLNATMNGTYAPLITRKI